MKISRREARETEYWLSLLHVDPGGNSALLNSLKEESLALRRILSAIIKKVE
ncbi:MAG: four helix bundle protein [Candidatus Pacebacteria bacterium]|nr:four helix bundle protein [Candidatus Paceibacterota bacterium]MCD8508382.1 four helix bundle protein [Candidatus Paceibacterota bacterium]MCD8527764.1 four helix bundle protein [Candidatus Paceibacterota bacterium]MCD8563696.1 four helix bundle protein [Candidatus Paceibacterota bacterium]